MSAIEPVREGVTVYRERFAAAAVHELDPGDVVVLRSDIAHRVDANATTSPRVAVYYRFACTSAEVERLSAPECDLLPLRR